jgi:aconitate hydratase
VQSLAIAGSETYDLLGLDEGVKPRQELNLIISRADGRREEVPVICRIDTPVEINYYRHGGILPFVLRQLVS